MPQLHKPRPLRSGPTTIGLALLVSLWAAMLSAPAHAFGFTYGSANNNGNNNGNILTQTIAAGAFSATQYYRYDPLNRLAIAAEGVPLSADDGCPGGTEWCRDYGYDRYGNRAVIDWEGISPHALTPHLLSDVSAATNRITMTSVVYDNAGNLTSTHLDQALAYDAENRQTSYTSTGTTTYAYDGQGNRVKKSGPAATSVYVYDTFGKLAAEYSDASAPTPGTFYRTVDHLGSTRLVTDGLGAAAENTDYLPFGEEIDVSSGDARYGIAAYGSTGLLRHKFTAKERDDESGLDYFGARYMSSALGRFTSADAPFMDQSPVDPRSWNLYTYTRNNPLRYVDSSGNFIETLWDVGNVIWGAKSFVDNVSQGNYGSAAVDAVGVIADSAAVLLPGVPGGAGVAIKVGRAGDKLNDIRKTVDKASDAASSIKKLPDDAAVVRGGLNTPDSFVKGSGVSLDANGKLQGVSVNSAPGQTVEQLSQGIPHNKVGVSTVGEIRAAGGDVVPSPTPGNPVHCTMCGVTPQQASQAMTVRPNPAKRRPEDLE